MQKKKVIIKSPIILDLDQPLNREIVKRTCSHKEITQILMWRVRDEIKYDLAHSIKYKIPGWRTKQFITYLYRKISRLTYDQKIDLIEQSFKSKSYIFGILMGEVDLEKRINGKLIIIKCRKCKRIKVEYKLNLCYSCWLTQKAKERY